ncbi:hypothetical protein ColLi_04768 [Colletotrichum liriopes]|uniref:NmrA-like domain-containing protein n=1 Tax=Colletotrichum liriopes TaxID=708192 RepID=A0AA37GJU3_9PEZI|nr:hypothetical protein ColLi_04768 [Colletotrichum liriopes]
MESITPKILVVGATGRTGSATISALTSLPNPPNILALTRHVTYNARRRNPRTPIPNLRRPQPHLRNLPRHRAPADEAQAIPLIDAAIANSVPHIVFSSVDRGGEDASWENPTAVPHFAAKHRVELHLRDKARGTATRWTILRPTGFMDNYVPSAGAMGPVMGGLWATMPRDRKMQLVSARDIGLLAARALIDGPEGGLAGDEISFAEAEEVFQRVVGRTMPQTWGGVGRVVRWAFEDAGRSMEWFEGEGYKADVEKLRAMEPRLQTWEAWLRETSGWVKGDRVD